MKKTLLFLLLFSTNTLLAAELFTINNSNTIVATKDSTNTIGLLLNQTFYQDILENELNSFSIKLPFITGLLDIKLERYSCYSEDLQVISKTKDGDKLLDIIPTLLSYRIIYQGESIGIMNFVNGKIFGIS